MLPKSSKRAVAQPTRLVLCTALALALSACGGGGGSPGVVPGGSNATNPATAEPKASMTILNGTTVVTSLSGGQSATVKVTLTNPSGTPAAGEIVKFAADGLLVFTPESGSALTDSAGVAVITIKPQNAESAGAAKITATATVGGKAASASANLAVGAAPLTLGALTFTTPAPAKLPAFSTLQLNVPITSGGQPATTSSGLVLSSLCTGDGTATIVPGSLANGVQTATYTNNGCVRGSDTITAQIGNSSQTISLGVDSANIGTIQFVGSDLTGSSIVLKGSGGLGRAESALLTFRVLDQNNQGLAGVDVDFTASTYTGGLTVAPTRGTTDSTGKVTTTVTSGTIPTPVRVFAQATRNGRTISGLSDTLTISTGLPIQKNVSLSADSVNIEGWAYDNVVSNITVRLADQYGNPISDGTAVSFVTEGGAIGSSAQGACTTLDGGCTVPLKSQDFRPANGRVTVMAYVQGVENFVDSNGDGQYTCTNFRAPDGVTIPSFYRPLVDTCLSGGEPFTDQGDPFLDAGIITSVVGLEKQGISHSLDGAYSASNGDLPVPYNRTTYDPLGNGRWGLNYLSKSAEIIFSGSTGYFVRSDCVGDVCTDAAATDNRAVTTSTGTGCSSAFMAVRIFDLHNNPMPSGTTVTVVDADKVTVTTITNSPVPSTSRIGGTIHGFNVKPDTTCAPGTFSLKITTPKGQSTLYNFFTN